MRQVYVWRDGQFVNKQTGEPMVDRSGPVAAPMVVSDTPGYRSPIDGSWIEGRRARRYDLEKNGCVEYDPDTSKRTPGEFKNQRFVEKYGL